MKAMKPDYITSAIEFFSKVLQLYECMGSEKNSKNKFAKSFNTRARSGPQLIKDLGVIPYITFLASKSGEDLMVKAYGILTSSSNICEGVDENIRKGAEKMGYAVYAIAILDYLVKLGVININKYSTIDVVRMLNENLRKYRVVEPIIMNYLNELRKLSTAYFKEEQE